MANTYTQLLFHVVFSTKNRERTLTDGHRNELYKYIWGIHKKLKIATFIELAESMTTFIF